jgi:hypothetical protein
MGYLVLNDYKTYIQGDYLRQLTQADPDKRLIAEKQAMQDVVQRITQKYDLDLELTATAPWDKTRAYGAGERATIALSASGFTEWAASTVYVVGAAVIHLGSGYFCITGNSDATFLPSKWALAGKTNDIFYVGFPNDCTIQGEPAPATLTEPYKPMFNYRNLYNSGDIVWWRGYKYTNVQPSTVANHQVQLQYTTYENLPFWNVFPDSPLNATQKYWNNKTAFLVPAGTPLTDTDWWVAGDNRNQTIKAGMVVITVFRLSPLLAPGNKPEHWLEDYRGVLSDLNDAAQGLTTLVLPMVQPQRGLKTRTGGDIKNVNNY